MCLVESFCEILFSSNSFRLTFLTFLPFVFVLLKVDAAPAVVPPSKSAKKGIEIFLYFAAIPSCFVWSFSIIECLYFIL